MTTQGTMMWLVGCSTSGEHHDEAPSIDVDLCETPGEAVMHLLEIFEDHYADKADHAMRQTLRAKVHAWRRGIVEAFNAEIDGFFHDDEMGTIYYIIARVVGARTIVS